MKAKENIQSNSNLPKRIQTPLHETLAHKMTNPINNEEFQSALV